MAPVPTVLERILAEKRREIAARKAAKPLDALLREAAAAPTPRDFAKAVARPAGRPIRLIAEFKRASPSKGVIRNDLSPADVARMYRDAGAAAMSVLTDGPFFHGSLDDLLAARAAVDLPLLRKDFVLERYQLAEARAAGADAALLIAAALSDEEMERLIAAAGGLGLAALVEVHDEDETRRALGAGARIIGVNNRDLRTFRVDIGTTLRLLPLVPAGIPVVGESGIHTRDDVLRLETAGVSAVLVGERLMRDPDPGHAARLLLGEGREG